MIFSPAASQWISIFWIIKEQYTKKDGDHDDVGGDDGVGVGDTLSDSIQCLNFAEKRFNSIFDSILLTQNSIPPLFHEINLRKLKTETDIQFKIISGGSIQKIIQFNSQGIIDTGRNR